MPVITQLWVYPIKSCRGVALSSATLLPSGLQHDREMMIVDADSGQFVTQRSDTILATIDVALDGESVILQHGKKGEIRLQKQFDTPVMASVWNRQVPAFDQGDNVADFLSAVIGRRVRLLATRPSDTLTAARCILFQDGRAIHILTEATLNHVRQHLPEISIDARRFRPNIVIGENDSAHKSLPAFAEDYWQQVHTPFTTLAIEKLCERCNVPSINPENLCIEHAVHNYLSTHRLINGKLCLGVNGRGAKLGRLQVGEAVSAV